MQYLKCHWIELLDNQDLSRWIWFVVHMGSAVC